MDKIGQWITDHASGIQSTVNVIVGVVAVVIIGLLIVKSIRAFGNENMKDGFKSLGFAALVVFVAFLSIKGVTAALDAVKPDDFQYGQTSLPGASPDVVHGVKSAVDTVVTTF